LHILTRLQRTKRSTLAKRRETYRAKLYTTHKFRPLNVLWPDIIPQSLHVHLPIPTLTQPQLLYSLHILRWKPTHAFNITLTTVSLEATQLPLTQNQALTNKSHTLLGPLIHNAKLTPHTQTPTRHNISQNEEQITCIQHDFTIITQNTKNQEDTAHQTPILSPSSPSTAPISSSSRKPPSPKAAPPSAASYPTEDTILTTIQPTTHSKIATRYQKHASHPLSNIQGEAA